MTPDDLFDPAHYDDVRRPLLEASTLPPWCYTSARFHRREVERIFTRLWQFVGRVDELARPGDYLTFDGAAGPVLIVRDAEGEVRAFHNTCRHRGTRLLHGKGRCARIVCPYHSWVYETSGRLVRTPGMDGVTGFRRDDYGLLPVHVEMWAGFVFVRYAEEGPSLAEYLGNMPEFFAAYRPEDLVCVRRVEFDIACNWKLVMENALEAYHTGSVHRASLGRQHSKPVDTRGHWDALFVHVEDDESLAVLPGDSTPLPHIEGLSGDQKRGTYFTDIYPCTQFVFAQDCMWWLAFQPLAVDRTQLTLGSCFPAPTVRLDAFPESVERYYARWDRATPEDNAIGEAQQAGISSLFARPGRFAPEEGSVHRLDNWVLDRVLDEG